MVTVEAAADAVRQQGNLNIQRKSKRGSEWEIQQVLCFTHLVHSFRFTLLVYPSIRSICGLKNGGKTETRKKTKRGITKWQILLLY